MLHKDLEPDRPIKQLAESPAKTYLLCIPAYNYTRLVSPVLFSHCSPVYHAYLCVCVVDAKVYPPLVCGGWYLVTPPGSQLTCPAKCSTWGYERGSRTGLTTKTPRPRPRLDIQLYTPNRSRSDL